MRTERSVLSTEYGAENAEEVRARTAAWKAEHPDGSAEWHRQNPDKAEFYESRKDPERVRENARTRYDINPLPKRAAAKKWAEANPETKINNQLLGYYGITIEQRELFREFQDGICAIPGCGSTELVVEHNHDTQQVRGLTCSPCNLLLGRLGDSADAVALNCARMLEYLAASGDFVSDEIANQLISMLERAIGSRCAKAA